MKSCKVLIGMAIFACSAAFLLPGQEFGDSAEPGGQEDQAFNQGVVPEALSLPRRGDESPRYPRDLVIGELGQGAASDGAWRYARNLLQGVLSGNRESALLAGIDPGLLEELFISLEPLTPQRYRIGGGREEPDGSTSFLFRFIGRDQGLAGELYLMLNENTWKLEDIIVEEARNISEGGNSYRFDFSPYERFF